MAKAWTCDEVLARLGEDAQVAARGIVVCIRKPDELPKHILIAEFLGDTFHVTPEGLAYLEPNEEDAVIVSETKKPARAKKKAPSAEPGDDIEDLLQSLDD